MNNKVKIFTNNIFYLVICAALFLLLLFLARFSLPAIFICLITLVGAYLFLYKKQKELVSYCLICASFFIIFYLSNIVRQSFLILIFSIPVSFLICRFLLTEKEQQPKTIYILIVSLVLGELALVILFLNFPLMIKAIIVSAVFYLFSGFANLNFKENTITKNIFTYCAIFSVIIIMLINIAKI